MTLAKINIHSGDHFGVTSYNHFVRAVQNIPVFRTPTISLPTGNTPLELFSTMTKAYLFQGLPNFHYVQVDEYDGVDRFDPRSYERLIEDNVLSPLGLKDQKLRTTFHAKAHSPRLECERFERRLQEIGGIDIAVLGIGSNGHIAFNEPGTPFNSRSHFTQLAPSTLQANAGVCGAFPVPTHAFTQGLDTIMASRKVILLAKEGKEDILYKALYGPVTEDVPASILQRHPNLTVVVDSPVAQSLQKRRCPVQFDKFAQYSNAA